MHCILINMLISQHVGLRAEQPTQSPVPYVMHSTLPPASHPASSLREQKEGASVDRLPTRKLQPVETPSNASSASEAATGRAPTDIILDLLQRRRFPPRWTNWISALLAYASSNHFRDLWQGDPLSPFIFILAIDPIQRLLQMATELGHLQRTHDRSTSLGTSLYTDDAAIFMSPTEREVTATTHLLQSFGMATGLQTNFQKSTVHQICCDHTDLDTILNNFPAICSTFPTKYLGLPLTYRRVRRTDYQPLVDKLGGRLAGWKGKLLTPVGRIILVKAVLSSIPIYFRTIFKPPKGVLRALDRTRRRFLWAGQEAISGEKCKIRWEKVYCLTRLGGLGILNLQHLSLALRLC